jgi:hypothetical protein
LPIRGWTPTQSSDDGRDPERQEGEESCEVAETEHCEHDRRRRDGPHQSGDREARCLKSATKGLEILTGERRSRRMRPKSPSAGTARLWPGRLRARRYTPTPPPFTRYMTAFGLPIATLTKALTSALEARRTRIRTRKHQVPSPVDRASSVLVGNGVRKPAQTRPKPAPEQPAKAGKGISETGQTIDGCQTPTVWRGEF